MLNCAGRLFIGLLLVAVLPGCVETRTLRPDVDYGRSLKIGESVTVFEKDGTRTPMIVGMITDAELIGSLDTAPYPLVAIPWSNITGIAVERVHAGKTTAAVLAGIILIPPAIALGALDDSCFGNC